MRTKIATLFHHSTGKTLDLGFANDSFFVHLCTQDDSQTLYLSSESSAKALFLKLSEAILINTLTDDEVFSLLYS